MAPPETMEDTKDATIKILEEELKKLKLDPATISPGFAQNGPGTPVTDNFKAPLPPNTSGQSLGQQTPIGPSLGNLGQTPSSKSLSDIEKMVRDHVTNNQQFINSHNPSQGSYTGPNIAQIRQMPDVQSQADLIMQTIKNTCPVFGQNQPVIDAAHPGINPLTAPTNSNGLNTAGSNNLAQGNNAHYNVGHGNPAIVNTAGLNILGNMGVASNGQANMGHGNSGLGNMVMNTPLQNHLLQQNLQQQINQMSLQQMQLGLGYHQNPMPFQSQQTVPISLQPQQAQNWLNQTPQMTQTSQIPPHLLSSLSQLDPSVAAPLLQALQTTASTAQPNHWVPQHQLQQHLQTNLIQGQQVPVQPHVGNILGQPSNLQLGQQLPHQQFSMHQTAPQGQQQTTSQQGMSSSSMTGVVFVRPTEFSKYCQVEYAKKAKADNCNLVLYVWGYMAQILASKQGLLAAMPDQEVIGRLQHLLHVLELCAMQSSSTDYNGASWLCAKNYSDRVFQDLDCGSTSWSLIGPKMHPTNMMQAMSAHPKVTTIPYVKSDKAKAPSIQPEANAGPVCPKWASCEVDDKCQWEVDSGRTCNRPHYCGFCHKKFKQTWKHKEANCRKKTDQAGDTQPSS